MCYVDRKTAIVNRVNLTQTMLFRRYTVDETTCFITKTKTIILFKNTTLISSALRKELSIIFPAFSLQKQ